MIAAQQAQRFAAMAVCGAACMAAYDALQAVVILLRGGGAARAAVDLALGPLLAVGMTLTALHVRMDPMRLYAFAAVGCGAAVWRLSGGALARRAWRAWARMREKRKKAESCAQKRKKCAGKT